LSTFQAEFIKKGRVVRDTDRDCRFLRRSPIYVQGHPSRANRSGQEVAQAAVQAHRIHAGASAHEETASPLHKGSQFGDKSDVELRTVSQQDDLGLL